MLASTEIRQRKLIHIANQCRNNILKDCYKDASLKFLLDDYEEVIINCGEKIINYRKKYIEQIKKTAPKIYEGISSSVKSKIGIFNLL